MSHAEHMKMMPTPMDTHKASNVMSMMHMKMYFNTDLPFILLFGPWEIDNIGKLIGAFIGVLLLAALYEACSAFREKLLLKAACRNQCPPVMEDVNSAALAGPSCPSCPASSNDTTKSLVDSGGGGARLRLMSTLQFRRIGRFFDGLHVLQTLLHLIQMFIGYMLMLIVMTYNVYMLIAVMAGFTVGYLIFARRRPLLLRSPTCCH
ncbi:High affinity copper uptake protein 1 [Paragonimus heterotremus]|uniref:Copper transport protein n=1 Tax=Paragonimus heterotremus TaxID=100268 RepID=A0A8J4T014_9TREM|nr:High affinity copper uptake protein 1 [Paragonimus heterotremus]